MNLLESDLNYLKYDSTNWDSNSFNTAYSRQTHMNTFDKSVHDFQFDKANPNFQKHTRGTVPISLSDTFDQPKPIDKSQKRPFLCRCVTNICKSIGRGWLFPKSSYFHLEKSDLTWCVPDACGSVCAVFTWLLIFYAVFVVIFVIILPAPSFYFRWINGVGFLFLSSMAFLSHLKSMFTNPGTISLGNATPENVQLICTDSKKIVYKCVKCDSIKPQRAHHCSICRRCVMKMDHHCPWVNNCIGECNQKYFVLFTFYICAISIYSIYISIHFFFMCVGSEWEECKDGFGPAASTIMIVFLLVEGILFGLFTSIMCGEQLQSIWLDETGIESLKKEQASWERKSKWLNMQLVFGHPPSWRWLCPLVEPRIKSTLLDSRVNSLYTV